MTDLLKLHLHRAPRRWRVGEDSGATFAEDEDFDGHTLTIELLDEAEADMIARALRHLMPHWRPSDDRGENDD
jgi:hypothetical protein